MSETTIAGLDHQTAGSLSVLLTLAVLVSLEYVQPTITAAGYQIAGLVVHSIVALTALALALAVLRR